VHEGEASVGGTESWQGAALVRVEEASRPSDGGQSVLGVAGKVTYDTGLGLIA